MAMTVDDCGWWYAVQPTAPSGANPVWNFVASLKGSPGSMGEPGVGLPGPQGQVGPQGMVGAPGSMGPAGKNSFSYSSQLFNVPAVSTAPTLVPVTDSSWMTPGLLVYIPGAGTFTCIGAPPSQFQVLLANS